MIVIQSIYIYIKLRLPQYYRLQWSKRRALSMTLPLGPKGTVCTACTVIVMHSIYNCGSWLARLCVQSRTEPAAITEIKYGSTDGACFFPLSGLRREAQQASERWWQGWGTADSAFISPCPTRRWKHWGDCEQRHEIVMVVLTLRISFNPANYVLVPFWWAQGKDRDVCNGLEATAGGASGVSLI